MQFKHTLNIDCETYSSVDLKKCGMYKYVESDDFEILMIAYSIDGGDVEIIDLVKGEFERGEKNQFIDFLFDPNVKKIAYNAQFERICFEKFFNKPMPPEQWECTMIKGAMLGLPMGLASIASVLQTETQKDFAGAALIRYFCLPCKPTKANDGRTRNLPHHNPEKWEAFKSYCMDDVRAEMSVGAKLAFFEIPEKEKRLWGLDQWINGHGVLVDKKFVRQAIEMDRVVKEQLTREAMDLTQLDNPNSVSKLLRWLSDETGDELTTLRKADVPVMLKAYDDAKVTRVLEIRQEMAKTSVSKYLAMARSVCADGRIRGLFQFAGARTMRWAGRLVQMQNLPQNHLNDLDLARALVREGDLDSIEMGFGNVPDTLSQLIRTAFVAPKGKLLGVFDFSAIEARVIAWCANEQWRLEVFATHGKIYEASASKMFSVPIESVTKGSDLRQKGKISELALGYGGGVGALTTMGAIKMGLTEDELQPLVDAWRAANPNIVRFWKRCEQAAISAVEGQPVALKDIGVRFFTKKSFLFIELPSGRCISYYKPHIKPGKFGGKSVAYWGTDSVTKKWCVIDSYGGKFVENCLAADTKVLTLRGEVNIVDVTNLDYLWDGVEWVAHQGLICKGQKETISLNGVRLTPDHKILTYDGWKEASSVQGFDWYEVQLPYSARVCRIRRKKVAVESAVRLRQSKTYGRFGVCKKENPILRVFSKETYVRKIQNPRNVKASSVSCMALNARQMQASNTPSVAQLRRSRHIRLRKVEQVHEFLGGYGADLHTRTFVGAYRRKRELHPRKLYLGNYEGADTQQKISHQNKYPLGAYNSRRSVRKEWYKNKHSFLQNKSRSAGASYVLQAGRNEQVYDLVNAGPRHRFTVISDNGPIIAHNCVQAIARDCLAESLLTVAEHNYPIVFHVHDELVVELPCETAEDDFKIVKNIMSRELPWAKGLPLTADGYLTKFYKKD